MRTITDKQFDEYKLLKKWAKKQKVWESADSITSLKDDIDLPIRKSVAMLSLLGFSPLFSCCGFDYKGQPFHKSHQYGEPYIMVSLDKYSSKWIGEEKSRDFINPWKIKKFVRGSLLIVLKDGKFNPHWRKKDCIHFSEECVLCISTLERTLLTLKDSFANEALILDTNQNYSKNGVRHWQYPPKEPWLVRKDLLDTY